MGNDAHQIFAAIDSMSADAFLEHLTDDVSFRWGANPPSNGHEEVRAGVEGFWSTIGGLKHHIRSAWDVEDDLTVYYIDVEYTRKDGGVVTVPNVDLLRFRGDKVYDWQIVIDVAPVYA